MGAFSGPRPSRNEPRGSGQSIENKIMAAWGAPSVPALTGARWNGSISILCCRMVGSTCSQPGFRGSALREKAGMESFGRGSENVAKTVLSGENAHKPGHPLLSSGTFGT